MPYNDEIRKLLQVATRYGVSRYDHEPLLHWQERLSRASNDTKMSSELKEILHLYYNIRFGPDSAGDRMMPLLKSRAGSCLDTMRNKHV